MALRDDRKGMISLMDAMIFVTLMALVSASLFTMYCIDDSDEPDAKDICDEFISIRLKASDVFDTEDSEVYDISTLIASHMASDTEDEVEEYIENVIDDLVPKTYGFRFEINVGDESIICQRESTGELISEYRTTIRTIADVEIDYRLSIY